MLKKNKLLYAFFFVCTILAFKQTSFLRASIFLDYFFNQDVPLSPRDQKRVQAHDQELESEKKLEQLKQFWITDANHGKLLLGRDSSPDNFDYFEQQVRTSLKEFIALRTLEDQPQAERKLKQALVNEIIWSCIALYRNKDYSQSGFLGLYGPKEPRESIVLRGLVLDKPDPIKDNIIMIAQKFYRSSFDFFKQVLSPAVLATQIGLTPAELESPLTDTTGMEKHVALCERYALLPEYKDPNWFYEIDPILKELIELLSTLKRNPVDNPLYSVIVQRLKNILKTDLAQWRGGVASLKAFFNDSKLFKLLELIENDPDLVNQEQLSAVAQLLQKVRSNPSMPKKRYDVSRYVKSLKRP